MFLSIMRDAENDFKILVRKITVRILPTRPHLRSVNFGPRFTHWRSARPQVRILHMANFNTLTLPELPTYHIVKFGHNYHQNKLPSIFSNYFIENYLIHMHNTAVESIFILNIHIVPWGSNVW